MKTKLTFSFRGEPLSTYAERASVSYETAPLLAEIGDVIYLPFPPRYEDWSGKVVGRLFQYDKDELTVTFELEKRG